MSSDDEDYSAAAGFDFDFDFEEAADAVDHLSTINLRRQLCDLSAHQRLQPAKLSPQCCRALQRCRARCQASRMHLPRDARANTSTAASSGRRSALRRHPAPTAAAEEGEEAPPPSPPPHYEVCAEERRPNQVVVIEGEQTQQECRDACFARGAPSWSYRTAFGTAHVNDTASPLIWEPLARPLPQCLCADTETFAGFVDDPDYDTYSMAGPARMPLHYQVRRRVGARASR